MTTNLKSGVDSETERVIALDGGTTNTRARLIQGDRVIATARRPVGVRDAASGSGRGRAGLVDALRAVIADVEASENTSVRADRLVAAGMLSSEVGLAAVPHVIAPAGLDDLARASVRMRFPEVDDRPILIVPGIRTPPADGTDGWFDADIMRGEECETFGALGAMIDDGRLVSGQESLFVWPGSHTKLVAVDGDGRITRSFTTLAGELLQAVARHTLIAASLPDELPGDPDPDAVAAGARAASRSGLGRAAFLVRIAAIGETLDSMARAAFWIGAAVESDVIAIASHPMLASGRSVFVGGVEPLRGLYAGAMSRRHGGPVIPLPLTIAERASARGALVVEQRRRVLDSG